MSNSYKNFSDFRDALAGKPDSYSLLLGNGFCKSHPELGEYYEFDPTKVAFILKELEKKKFACPEHYLAELRKIFIKEVINGYTKKFPDDYYHQLRGTECKLFNNSKHVFTTNYD